MKFDKNVDPELIAEYMEVQERKKVLKNLLGEAFSSDFCNLEFSKILSSVGANSESVILDLGANIGQQIKDTIDIGATIHAFEPHPVIFDLLVRGYGEYENAILLNAAAGASRGKFRLFYKGNAEDVNGGATLLPWKVTGGDNVIDRMKKDSTSKFADVDCYNISEYIENLGKKVKILKIDVEGLEYAILDNLMKTGQIHNIEYILFEDHADCFMYKTWFDIAIKSINRFKNSQIETKIMVWNGFSENNDQILSQIMSKNQV
tara:strand:- start:391 stop:1176 length:786 start_codon:yes stop_codon:yes gene_type:complete